MFDEDPESTPMLGPKTLKFRDFYLRRFGQFLSEIGNMYLPNPIPFFFFIIFDLSRAVGLLYVY
jgi:hypothetical protein